MGFICQRTWQALYFKRLNQVLTAAIPGAGDLGGCSAGTVELSAMEKKPVSAPRNSANPEGCVSHTSETFGDI